MTETARENGTAYRSPEAPEKSQKIRELLEARDRVLEDCARECRTASLPSFRCGVPKAFDYLIPRGLMEAAREPERAGISFAPQKEDALNGVLVIHDHSAGRSFDDVEHEYERLRRMQAEHRDYDAWQRVDFEHAAICRMRRVDPCDMPCMHFEAYRGNYPDVVYMRSYGCHPDLRGQGINAEFYERFITMLSALRFRYLTGNNSEINYRDFFQKSGRLLYRDAASEMRGHLLPPDILGDQPGEYYTYQKIPDWESAVRQGRIRYD